MSKESLGHGKRESQTNKNERETCRKQSLQEYENARNETIINLFRKVSKEIASLKYE